MDDLERDLVVLLRDRADRTDVPHLPLDDVLARGDVAAGRLRRRNSAIALIAVAAVIAAIAIPAGIQALRSSSPSPTLPATPTTQDQALSFIRTITAPAEVAIAPDGRIVTLWARCGVNSDEQPCEAAWMMQPGFAPAPSGDTGFKPTKTYAGWAPGDAQLEVSGVDLVITSYASDKGFVLERDGTTTDLKLLKATTPTETQIAGSSVVEHTDGIRLVNAHNDTWLPVRDDQGKALSTGFADDSTLWGERDAGDHVDLEESVTGGEWLHHALPGGRQALPGRVAAEHGHVLAASDLPGTGEAPIGGISVSSDNGGTWTDVTRASLPFTDISGMATTDDGALFISSSDGSLYQSSNGSWTRFESVPGASNTRVLQPDYDDVLLLQLDGNVPSGLGLVADGGSVRSFGPPFATLVPSSGSPSPSAAGTLAAVSDLPVGGLPKVPYIRNRQVVINGIPNNAPAHYSLLAAGGVVVVGSNWTKNGASFWVYRGYREQQWAPAPWLHSDSWPTMDANGRYAATLTYPNADTTRITEVDPMTGVVYGVLDLDQPRSCCGGSKVQLEGIDIYGNVYYLDWNPSSLMRWAPHKIPVKLGTTDDYSSTNPLGVVMKHPHEPGVLYRVRADVEAQKLPSAVDDGHVWSQDGHRLLTESEVVDVETGETYPFALPPQLAVTPLGFENDDVVELVVHNAGAVYPSDHPASILRCFVSTGKCERAEDLPNLKKTQFPQTF